MAQLDTLQQKWEHKQYADFLQEIDEVLQQLAHEERWSELLTQLFNKVRAYLALNNQLAAANVLTEQQAIIAAHSDAAQQMMYYHLLAASLQGVERVDKVLSYLQKAQLLAELYEERALLPMIYYDLSVLTEQQGDVEMSFAYAEKSVQLTMDEATTEALLRQLHYIKQLITRGEFEQAAVRLANCQRLLEEAACSNETIACWKVEAQLLGETVGAAQAYAFLKEKVAHVAEHHVWCDQLYDDICRYAKVSQSNAVYIRELHHALTMKERVLTMQNQQQLELLQTYTDDAAMKKLACTDSLTGIPNRRYLQQLYASLKPPFTFFLFDVDSFKRINDTAGHLIGDEVLIAIVRAVSSALPQQAHFVRLGGDEFVGIVYDSPSAVLRNMLEAVRAIAISHDDCDIRPTISIGAYGVSELTTLQQTLQQADEALYAAKARGKNQYVLINEGFR